MRLCGCLTHSSARPCVCSAVNIPVHRQNAKYILCMALSTEEGHVRGVKDGSFVVSR